MNMEDEVRELIDCHGEGDYLDFKEYDYHKENKEELVKDILAFSNSHSTRNKYIIIGATEENNVCTGLKEIDKTKIRDEAEFQQIINTYIYENLIVNYKVLNIDGTDILVIQIPAENNSNRPFMVKKQIGKLKENEVYIRKSSSTGLATKKDLEYMFRDNKNSKLIVQSYLNGNISNKIQLSTLNTIIEQYKNKKLEKLKQLVSHINQLKGESFSFSSGLSFLVSDEIVKLEEEKEKLIKKGLNKLELTYDDSIFEFKNVRWKTTFNGGGLSPISKVLYGDNSEIERYWALKELDTYILEYLSINSYFENLPQIYTSNLLISNIGNYFDEDIELKLIIDKDSFFQIDNLVIDDNSLIKYLGNMYHDLRKDIIDCPVISNIDEYEYPILPTHNVPTPHIPSYIGSMYSYEPTYSDKLEEKSEDFKSDIESLFADSIYEENDKIILKTNFRKIMQNRSMFLESKLLFKNNNLSIQYEIRSKNNPKIIIGTIEN